MSEDLKVFGKTYTGVTGIQAKDTDGLNLLFQKSIDRDKDLCEPKDVDFIDYDGRLLYSYTDSEFAKLTSLPPNPTNEGLVAQGWNWTLEDAQDFVGKYGALVVGQNYTTDDGRTRIYITISNDFSQIAHGLAIPIYIDGLNSANYVTIDWGDGSEPVTVKSGKFSNHIYNEAGDYIISIEVTGSVRLGYWGSNNRIIGQNFMQQNFVTKVEIGNGIIGLCRNTFNDLINLKSVSIPITCISHDTGQDYSIFQGQSLTGIVFPSGTPGQNTRMVGNTSHFNIHLKYISIPKSMNGFIIGSSHTRSLRKLTFPTYTTSTDLGICLQDTSSLTHFIVPGTYISIKTDMCRASLIEKLTIPETVVSIAATAFAYNTYLKEVHLLPVTPPTLAHTNAFNTQVSETNTCVFYVPYSEDHSILEAYKTATNWSTFAEKMQEEPQS